MHTWFLMLLMMMIMLASAEGHEAIDQLNFEEKVLNSDKPWLLEFYSDMCGSCREFAPTFEQVASALSSSEIQIGMVGIDQKEGMDLANALGILEEGIPNVRLFSRANRNGLKIMPGEMYSKTQLLESIQSHLATLKDEL